MNSLPPYAARRRRRDARDLDELRVPCSRSAIFFTLMIVGLSSRLPHAMHDGLVAHGVAGADATRVSELPPVTTLFAAFLGYNPMETLLGAPTLAGLPPDQAAELTGRSFFPDADLRPVPHGARLRVRLRDRRVPDRRGRVAAARRQVPPREADGARGPVELAGCSGGAAG